MAFLKNSSGSQKNQRDPSHAVNTIKKLNFNVDLEIPISITSLGIMKANFMPRVFISCKLQNVIRFYFDVV